MFFIYNLFLKNCNNFLTINLFFGIRAVFFLIISLINIICDIKHKKVYPLILIIFSAIFIISWVFIKPELILNIISAVLFSFFIYILIYLLSQGRTGLGDMLYLVFYASLFGAFFTVTAFLFSYWIASIILIAPLILKKINMKSRIPFIPFLFTGGLLSISYGIIWIIFIK